MPHSVVAPCSAGRGPSGRRLVVGLLCALLLSPWHHAAGQSVNPDVRQRALEAFHGPDQEGKDGPLAKAGFDLALLYYEWRAYQEQGAEEAFAPSGALPVRDGRVTIDATAAQDPSALRDSLEALGLTGSAQAGPVVSGRLPIAAISDAAHLAHLRAIRPARARTHTAPVTPSARPDTGLGDTMQVGDNLAPEDIDPASGEASQPAYWIGGIVILILGLLFFLLRRTP